MAAQIKVVLILILLVGAMLLSACSPEAGRQRAGGLGADIGNRDPNTPIEFHGEVWPYWDTPIMGLASQRIEETGESEETEQMEEVELLEEAEESEEDDE
ncbi:MAG: hypothetical protein M3220_15285 [Chloroflexota bacterium]|nr:hypothetical protein [Chloroflexota bacterium]